MTPSPRVIERTAAGVQNNLRGDGGGGRYEGIRDGHGAGLCHGQDEQGDRHDKHAENKGLLILHDGLLD